LGDNVAHFSNREERERYMDSLERQMEHQREQIERTLDEIEGSSRRRTALEKLRNSLPSLPGRTSVRDVERGKSEAATERPDSEAPRNWWQFWR
jgi:hypothetical protein